VIVAIVAGLVLLLGNLSNLGGRSATTTTTSTATVSVIAGSELCWSGAIGDSTKDGCGTATFQIDGIAGIYSANAQKQSDDQGELTLVLTINGAEVDRATTFAAYGIAQVQGSAER